MTENRSDLESLGEILELLLLMNRKKIAAWEKELATMPNGNLHLDRFEGKTYFKRTIDGRRRGISQDEKLIYRLARKRYLQILLGDQQEVMRRIHDISDPRFRAASLRKRKRSGVEKLLERYGKAGLTILRITCSEKHYQWTVAQYRRNTQNPEELKFETYSGIKVRSKSEQSIGNSLEIQGIPYRYEMEIRVKADWMEGINGMDFSGYKNYYPDFVILTTTGEIIIWEHLGRADLEKYREHNMQKIAAYRQCGVCDDDHLILTFEIDMKKTETVERLIAKRVRPYM